MSGIAIAEAFAPATVANLGVGFDILGMAVGGSGDRVRVQRSTQTGAHIREITGDDGKLPADSARNVAAIAANALLQAVDASFGVEIWLEKGLPIASGLGSSAASAVAAAVATNAVLDDPLPREALLPFALEGEAAVSGYHADNVAPCLLGGITLNQGTNIEQIRRLPVPDRLFLALVSPQVEVPTAEARAALPQAVTLKQMVAQTGAVAQLVDALHRGDVRAMADAMERDVVVEPARQHLMPHMLEVRRAAKGAGALALVISGAGPTLCAVCDDETLAQQVGAAMQAIYEGHGVPAHTQATRVLREGVSVTPVR